MTTREQAWATLAELCERVARQPRAPRVRGMPSMRGGDGAPARFAALRDQMHSTRSDGALRSALRRVYNDIDMLLYLRGPFVAWPPTFRRYRLARRRPRGGARVVPYDAASLVRFADGHLLLDERSLQQAANAWDRATGRHAAAMRASWLRYVRRHRDADAASRSLLALADFVDNRLLPRELAELRLWFAAVDDRFARSRELRRLYDEAWVRFVRQRIRLMLAPKRDSAAGRTFERLAAIRSQPAVAAIHDVCLPEETAALQALVRYDALHIRVRTGDTSGGRAVANPFASSDPRAMYRYLAALAPPALAHIDRRLEDMAHFFAEMAAAPVVAAQTLLYFDMRNRVPCRVEQVYGITGTACAPDVPAYAVSLRDGSESHVMFTAGGAYVRAAATRLSSRHTFATRVIHIDFFEERAQAFGFVEVRR